MSKINNLCILLFTVSLVYTQDLLLPNSNTKNYGPYNLDFQDYSDCKGPKAKNMTLMTTSLDENFNGFINFTFFADTKLEEVKIRVYNIKDNKKIFLWNYKLSDPCKHFSIALLIQQQLKAEHCFIKKGVYLTQFNLRDVLNTFMGPSFFYGNYSYKADLLSKKGNIGCLTCTMVFTKKQ